MPYDWSNPYDSVIAYDVGNPQTLALAGISSAESLSHPTIIRGPIDRTVTGIPTAQALSPIHLDAHAFMNVSGVPSAEFLQGTSVIDPFFFNLSGAPSAEAFGFYTQEELAPAPILVQTVRNFGISGTTASIAFTTSNIVNGNAIIVAAAIALPTAIVGVDDTAGNVYTPSITNINSGLSCLTIWIAPITQGAGTKPTVHIRTSGTGLVYAFLWEWSGLNRSSFPDRPAVASPVGSIGLSVTSGAVSTVYPNDVLIGICICGTTVTASTPGWAAIGGASNPRVTAESFVAVLPGIYSADFTQTSSSSYNAALASFRSTPIVPARASRII